MKTSHRAGSAKANNEKLKHIHVTAMSFALTGITLFSCHKRNVNPKRGWLSNCFACVGD